MNTSNIEQLLETLINEIRDLKLEVKNEISKLKTEVKEVNDELNWWSKDKHSFAKQVLSALERIGNK